MTTTLPPGPTRTPGGFDIDHRLGAAALRAPAASREDSCPQTILKFHHPSSLDYRARHGPRLPLSAGIKVSNLSFPHGYFIHHIY